MYAEFCKNGIVDENDRYKRRRCKITGYLCRPTTFGNFGTSKCVLEPQYLDHPKTKQLIEVIKHVKPGMRVYMAYKMTGGIWGKVNIHTTGGTIKEILEDGMMLIKFDSIKCKWSESVHELTRSIKLEKEELEAILQKAAAELETEERIKKESGEEYEQ